jgi:3-keto-disaccharide hydrolase
MRTTLGPGLLFAAACWATAARGEEPKPPEGFTAIFNGKDLTGWKATGKMDVWTAEDGVILCKGGNGGWLLTEKDYSDFELTCEYRWRKKGTNSGIALRTPAKGDPAYVGMEIQLIDDETWPGKLADYQHTGSIYDVQPAKPAANKPIGEWNAVRIVCKGRNVTVEQNGKELVKADLDDYRKDNHPGLKRASGKIGFQSYNQPVEFRNVYIKELK